MKEGILHSTGEEQETAVLVAVTSQKQNAVQTAEYLAELAFLASTSGVLALHSFTQNLAKPLDAACRQGFDGASADAVGA